ncbi:hypothetical protein PoB_000052200 [Plakobranchus ocellatus]|uniref:Uncharacterized protein n=1 Tax=Plakobranchus ocellatus TaxID=259542 RepID=A0AAV3XVZ0_9GAST|nr:hypothetical protein PoB_000052200 [Plakobranchus ocellatus]
MTKATSAVSYNNIGDWFLILQLECDLLSTSSVFNIVWVKIMTDALEQHEGIVSIGGRISTSFRVADDMVSSAGIEQDIARMVNHVKRPHQTMTLKNVLRKQNS